MVVSLENSCADNDPFLGGFVLENNIILITKVRLHTHLGKKNLSRLFNRNKNFKLVTSFKCLRFFKFSITC